MDHLPPVTIPATDVHTLLDYEQAYANRQTELPVHLYLAYGEPEVNDYERPFLERFLVALHSRSYAGFTLTHQLIPDCSHCAVVAPGFLWGLVAVFS